MKFTIEIPDEVINELRNEMIQSELEHIPIEVIIEASLCKSFEEDEGPIGEWANTRLDELTTQYYKKDET